MRSSVRWLVPVAAAAVVAGGVVVNSAAAGGAIHVPDRSAEQVLAALAGSDVTALSGTVVTRADIGFPSLPSMGGRSGGGASSTDAQGLVTRFLSGENTLRVYRDGPTRERAQLLDQFGELNVIRNGDQVWTYDSRHNAVQHGTIPSEAGRTSTGKNADKPGGSGNGATQLTPAEMAHRALAAADPTTKISLGDPELVAGRDAYALTLTPKTSATLIDHVVIAVDAARSVPLQVQVFARGTSRPVIETGFTAVDFATPAASMFRFTTPKGATVTEMGSPASGAHPDAKAGATAKARAAGKTGARPTEIGTGWATIVEMPAQQAAALPGSASGAHPDANSNGKSAGSLLTQLGTSVSGGRAISTKLVSVLFTDDGRILAGAVPVQALIDAAKR